MGTAENRRVVQDYFVLSNDGEIDELAGLLADEFIYRCRGKTPETSRTLNKHQLLKAMRGASAFWSEPVVIDIDEMTAEGDRVAVQATSRGVISDGTLYENAYHFLIRLADGKIRSLDEYFCTATFLNIIYARRGTGAGG